MLRGVAALIRDSNVRIRRYERVHEIDAHVRPVVVDVGELMTACRRGRYLRRRAQPNRSYASRHVSNVRKSAVDECQWHGAAVDGENHGAEHPPRIRLSLCGGKFPVAVGIRPAKYPRRHTDAGREI